MPRVRALKTGRPAATVGARNENGAVSSALSAWSRRIPSSYHGPALGAFVSDADISNALFSRASQSIGHRLRVRPTDAADWRAISRGMRLKTGSETRRHNALALSPVLH